MARLYIASDVPRQRGLKRRPLGTLLSLPDAVRPRGCQPLEPWPKAGLPLEQAVRGITPDTPQCEGVPPFKSPPKGCCPWMQLSTPFRTYPHPLTVSVAMER